MQLTIADNCNIKIKNSKKTIFINGSLQNSNSLKYYIEKDKKKIRSEISYIIKTKLSQKFDSLFKNKEDYLIWEMSSIFEINTLRTNSFYRLAQIICLRNIIKKYSIKTVNYYGSDENILSFLTNTKINLRHIDKSGLNKKKKRFHFLRGFAYFFKYIYINFSLILKKVQNQKQDKTLMFLSYLVHLNKIRRNYFASNHWGDITETANKSGYRIDWYYDFTPSHELRNFKKAKKFLNSFNKEYNYHNFLSEYLTLGSCFKVFYRFLYFTFKFHLIYKKKNIKIPQLLNLNLFNIFENEFQESFNGALLISNLFYVEIYRNFFNGKNIEKNIFFLLENQPWERAFLHFSKNLTNKKIFGCINSTTIFWDMRYFHHNKYDNFKGIDKILINGNLAKNYLKECALTHKIREVEAVRYKYLLNYKRNLIKKNKHILVLGEQSIPTTLSCLDYLSSDKNDKKYIFDFKPHPTTTIKVLNFIKKNYKNIRLINNSTRDVYKSYKYTIVVGSTSAIIEAIYFKTKILVYDKIDNFFLCPLFNNQSVSVIDENKKISQNLKNNILKIKNDELKNVANIKSKNQNWISFLNNL